MKLAILTLFLVSLQFCTYNAIDNGHDSVRNPNSAERGNTHRASTATPFEDFEQGSRVEAYDIGNSLGLVSANDKRYEQNSSIRILNEDGTLWYELSSKDKNDEGVITSKYGEFMPFRINADEMMVVMNCVGKDDRYYHVIVNEDTQLKKYVRKDDPILQLGTWEEYILDCFAVGFDSENNPIHDEPNGKLSQAADMPKSLNLRPEKIVGEWLKIRWHASNDEEQPARNGWIKWKIDQKIVLRLFETA